MAKPRQGYIYEQGGKIYARLSYQNDTGRHNFRRRAKNRTHARLILRELLDQLESPTAASPSSGEDFNALVDWYKQRYAIPPVYSDGNKIAGLRSLRTVLYRVRLLQEYFGNIPLRSLTYEDIRAYKMKRLDCSTPRGNKLSIQSVHRELALLRRILQLAVQSGKIPANPFLAGDPLIIKTHERGRQRVLTLDEETRLLYVCADERAHLRPIVICALDTGMRLGEILSLRWSDLDLPKRTITIQGQNTKTLTERRVPISARLAHELKKLWQNRFSVEQQLVFGVSKSVSKSWKTATTKANVLAIRFHDLRHTFASRMTEENINPLLTALIMGHASNALFSSMTLKYTHLTPAMIDQVIVTLATIDERRIAQAQGVATLRGHFG